MSTQEGGFKPAGELPDADSQGGRAGTSAYPLLPNPFAFSSGGNSSNGLQGDLAATARACLERLDVSPTASPAMNRSFRQARARAEDVAVATRVVTACPPGMLNSPCDVYHGEIGLALLFLRAHALNPYLRSLSALAKVSTRLSKHMEQGRRSYRCGFLDSPAGVYAVAAAVFHHTGMHDDDAEDALDALVVMKQIYFSISVSGDLLYGRPG
ncbi:hypothetical protein HK405_001698, partial [Cladochytrium tenue]